ncbi:hypothetical protein Tco_0286028 [Tanacetum coccineum]
MASLDHCLNPLFSIKECSSCGALYTADFCCSKEDLEDKILVPKPLQNCATCGDPVDGQYCRPCAFVRKCLNEGWYTIHDKNEILNTSESSNHNTNVVSAPQEPFVFNQDPGKNSSQSPPQINHNCCYECGDSLDGIFCQRCTCKSCGNGAHIGYNCPPKAPIISNPEQCNQTIDELPQTLPSVHPTCNSGDENSFTYDSKPNYVDDSPNVFNPPPQPEHQSIFQLRTLLTILQVLQTTSTTPIRAILFVCDVPLCNNPTPLEAFKEHSEIVVDFNDDSTSSDDDSPYGEDIDLSNAITPDARSFSTSLNLFLEETNTFGNSLPLSETFCFNLEEISSGSTTTRSDLSFLDYEAFYLDDDHIKEKSSGSTTTHADFSLPKYDSFIFDLSINLSSWIGRNSRRTKNDSVKYEWDAKQGLVGNLKSSKYGSKNRVLAGFGIGGKSGKEKVYKLGCDRERLKMIKGCQKPGHLAARLGCAETKVATWDDLAFILIILRLVPSCFAIFTFEPLTLSLTSMSSCDIKCLTNILILYLILKASNQSLRKSLSFKS